MHMCMCSYVVGLAFSYARFKQCTVIFLMSNYFCIVHSVSVQTSVFVLFML